MTWSSKRDRSLGRPLSQQEQHPNIKESTSSTTRQTKSELACRSLPATESTGKNMCITSSASSKDSHSNLARLHLKHYRQTESSHSPTSSTLWPWFKDKENNLGNIVLRLEFPTHTSSQNFTLSPRPNFHPISLRNHPSPPPSLQNLSKSLHHQDCSFTGVC